AAGDVTDIAVLALAPRRFWFGRRTRRNMAKNVMESWGGRMEELDEVGVAIARGKAGGFRRLHNDRYHRNADLRPHRNDGQSYPRHFRHLLNGHGGRFLLWHGGVGRRHHDCGPE